MPSNTKKRNINRRRPRGGRKGLHYALLTVFVLGLGAFLCLTVLFEVEEITVVGSDKYTAEEIIAASGIEPGDNLFRVPAGVIERELAARYPYIEKVSLHRLFPPSIEIRIEQSVPSVALSSGDELVLITRDGKVLERGMILLSADLLLVHGLDVTGREPGDYLGGGDEGSGLIMINYLLGAMEETGFTGLTNLDITDRLNMHVMYENRLSLQLGTEANLPDKLRLIRLVVEEKLYPGAHGILDAADIATKDWVIYTPASGFNSDGSPIERYNPEEAQNGA